MSFIVPSAFPVLAKRLAGKSVPKMTYLESSGTLHLNSVSCAFCQIFGSLCELHCLPFHFSWILFTDSFRLQCLHTVCRMLLVAADVACRVVVCLCVGHMGQLCKNG